MAYDEKIIEQIQSMNDIVEIISEYVPLKRAGKSFKANCPFHQEKTPSFIVNPDRQAFHCFGCGEGGDVFSFLMKHEHINFPEAVKMLADRVHMTLPESSSKPSDRTETDHLYQIYEAAQTFYHAQFMKSQAAERARAYWKSRGFGEKEAAAYEIGYSLEEWRKLFEYLSQKGFKQEILLRSGLIQRGNQGNPYDLFRGRLMFPIRNAQGRVIAFGARTLKDEMPKYLNSPETPIFSKRRELFGLFSAKKSIGYQEDIRRLLIVEGYLDCLQLQAHGFLNSVATLGTSLTNEHVRTMKRYADEAIVVYDGDKAGEQAALRGLDVFLEEGMSVKAISLPKGMDPDDFVRVKGNEAFQNEINQALDFFDFKLKSLLVQYNKADSIGLLKITGEFLETFAKIKNMVLVDRYLKKLAAILGVEERSLRGELDKMKSKRTSFSAPEIATAAKTPATAPPYEKMILGLVLHYPPYFKVLREALPAYEFRGEKTKALFQAMSEEIESSGEAFSSQRLMSHMSDAGLKAFASELLVMEWREEDREKGFMDCLEQMRKFQIDTQLKDLRSRISLAEDTGDQNKVSQLVKEYQRLLVETNKGQEGQN